jgi:hypothetical protein
MKSLRRHNPDQVMRVEDCKSSSQPGKKGSPFYLIKGSIDDSKMKVKEVKVCEVLRKTYN